MPITVTPLIKTRHPQGGPDLFTAVATYPRFIHAEAKTHRTISIDDEAFEVLPAIALMDDPYLSRNASSSRAVPVAKLIKEAKENPAIPEAFHYNRSGMQGTTVMSEKDAATTELKWLEARDRAVEIAEELLFSVNPHKQVINRLLEPFTHITTIMTASEDRWQHFWNLRNNELADPTMHVLAHELELAFLMHPYTEGVGPDGWHVPYLSEGERSSPLNLRYSAARCARVSYLNHDGTLPDRGKDLKLATLLEMQVHMTPFEHQAKPVEPTRQVGPLTGWASQRSGLEGLIS